MSPRELAHRLREKVDTEAERLGWTYAYSGCAVPNFREYLHNAAANHFYRGASAEMRTRIQTSRHDWVRRAIDESDRLCAESGGSIDWHGGWERLFWSDYRLEDDPAGRDPKFVFELNRHQHLPRLAKTFFLTGDERYAAEALAQLDSWIGQNPIGIGINWNSSLEIAIRTVSWMWTLVFLEQSSHLTDRLANRIGESLFAQLEHVYRHTSLYTSPNTHLIGEAAALFIGALTFPGYRRSAAWRDLGAALLIQESDRQILPDGFHAELSSYYHCYTLDFYLQAIILAERNQFPFPDALLNKTRSMLRVLMHLTRPDGTIPLLGDDDGGRALALNTTTYRTFQDGLGTGAALFRTSKPNRDREGAPTFEESAWLLGDVAFDNPAQSESETTAFFPDAGYAIQRTGWGPLDTHIVFDTGGLGMAKGTHAHADALSFMLFANGSELLVDPGTFRYNGVPRWRNYFRSTAAHNTATVDAADQAEPEGTFRWRSRFSTTVARETHSGIDYLEASHDAYRARGVRHRRRLLNIDAGYWLVIDDFTGAGEHRFTLHFHLSADADPWTIRRLGDNQIEIASEAADFQLCTIASAAVTSSTLRAQDDPVAGWTSHGYGDRRPCTSVHLAMQTEAPAFAMTFLAPSSRRLQISPFPTGVSSGLACRCEHDSHADIAVVAAAEEQLELAGVPVCADFAWLRLAPGAPARVFIPGMMSSGHTGKNEEALCARSVA